MVITFLAGLVVSMCSLMSQLSPKDETSLLFQLFLEKIKDFDMQGKPTFMGVFICHASASHAKDWHDRKTRQYYLI